MTQLKQSRPARLAPPQAGRAGADVFAALAKKTKFVDPSLAEHWPSIAGKEIAALCRPGRFFGARAGRTLEVHASSSAAAAQIQMLTPDLMTRLNRYLGPGAVATITVRQSAQFSAPGANPTGDKRLDQALTAFRTAVNKRKDRK